MKNRLVSQRVNREILRRTNEEVSLRATRFADTMLSSNFRSIFIIHQSSESANPDVYQFGDDPDRILWPRVSTFQAMHLPVSIAHEEIAAKRYQLESEYEFVVLVDVSRSMMLKWWYAYGYSQAKKDENRPLEDLLRDLHRSKVYLLKYILVSFLMAARRNGLTSKVVLFGGGKSPVSLSVRDEPELEETILTHIDDHFISLAHNNNPEDISLPLVLREQLEYQRHRIILCLSDFTDGITYCRKKEPRLRYKDIIRYFMGLGSKYRLLVVRINDERELKPDPGSHPSDEKGDTPYLDVETNPKEHVKLRKKERDKFVKDAKSWYRRLEVGLRRTGAILGTAVGEQEIDSMLNRISAIQERI